MLDLNSLFEQQMAQWPECRARYDQLSNAGRRSIERESNDIGRW